MKKIATLALIISICFSLVSIQSYAQSSAKKININTATVEELVTLPGIGKSTAEEIVKYRKKNGKFTSVDQLLEIKGIGPSKLNKIKDLITTM